MAQVHSATQARRPVLGFLSATASSAAFVAALFVYSEDTDSPANLLLTGSRVIDDAASFSVAWFFGWLAFTLFACVPFALLFKIGLHAGMWGLSYSLVVGVATSVFLYFLWLVPVLAILPPHSASVGFLLEGNALPTFFGIALAAGLIGGFTFWWVGLGRARGVAT